MIMNSKFVSGNAKPEIPEELYMPLSGIKNETHKYISGISTERLNTLKERIKSGAYKISSDEIALAILNGKR